MKTTVTTTILAIAFLSAGAFAGSNSGKGALQANTQSTNVTTIQKNGEWPLPYRDAPGICQISRCIEI